MLTADRVILDAEFEQRVRLVQIAAVENQRRFQDLLQRVEVRALEDLPFGEDHQRVGAVGGFHLVVHERQPRVLLRHVLQIEREHALRFVDGDRVVRLHRRAAPQQFRDQRTARRFAHVVGIRLEREAPHAERAVRQVFAQTRDDLVREDFLLRVVDGFHRFENAQVRA